ncbi:MAG TPA: hypothetical protein VLC08_01195, partial [Chitinolyticbacter sp.]|nr:hypothetical protein [Chitinolyticbacter sp.]
VVVPGPTQKKTKGKYAAPRTDTVSLLAGPAMARDEIVPIALADVLAMPEAQGKLDGTVKFSSPLRTRRAAASRSGGKGHERALRERDWLRARCAGSRNPPANR